MKDMQEVIDKLESLREHSLSRSAVYEALDETISKLNDVKSRLISAWTPIESGLPGENIDVQVTVQDMEYDGNVYQSIDCIIDNGDGPFWAEHHGAWDRVLAWAPMLPVYQPDEGRRD